MTSWPKVLKGQKLADRDAARKEQLHSTVLPALSGLGVDLMAADGRAGYLSGLDAIDWSKKKPGWGNICIIANSVVSNRQARAATKALIKAKLGLALTVGEERTLARPRRAAGSSRWTSFSPLAS